MTHSSRPQAGKQYKEKLPVKEKLAYGCGEPVNSFGGWIPTSMAGPVFNMSLGVSPILISLSLVVFRLWDAITDPLMGWISDNFRSRFGRRRPFIFIAAFLVGGIFPLMWLVNPNWSQSMLIGWFIGAGLLFYTAQTIGNIPYQSLLLEMTPDYNERTSISGYRAFIAKIFSLFGGWIWYLTQLPIFGDPQTGAPDTLRGMQAISIVLGVVLLLLGLMPALFCKERYYRKISQTVKIPLRRSLKETLQCKPFLLLAGLIVTMQIGGGMVNGLGAYVLTYYVFSGDQTGASFITGWGTSIAAFAGMASLPLVAFISSKVGKERTLMCLLLSKFLLSIAIWFCYNPHYPWLATIPLLLVMPLQTCLWMLVPSMLADVVDHDELHTGERREGSFSSIFSWLMKVAMSIGFGISGPLLEMTGFDAAMGEQQPDEVLLRMRIAMVVIPSLTCIFLIWILCQYPINKATAYRTRMKLEKRRGGIEL